MNQLLLRIIWSLLLLLSIQTVSAQAPWSWQYRYGETSVQACQQVLPLKTGGYLLIGQSNASGSASPSLYLVRTDAAGKELWTQTHAVADCNNIEVLPACENSAGQILVSIRAVSNNPSAPSLSTVAGLLLLLQPDGTVAWQKRTAAYPLQSSVPGSVAFPYSRAVLDATDNFLFAQNEPDETTLLRLDATGQQTQRIAFPMPAETLPTGAPARSASIHSLVPLAGGLFAYVVSNASARLVEISAQGVQGRTTVLPPVLIVNQLPQLNSQITDFLSLPNDDVLLVSTTQLARVQLHSGTVRWTSYNLQMMPQRAAQLPDGKLLIFGTVYLTHTFQLVMRVFDEAGQIFLGGLPNPATGLSGALQYSFGNGMKASAGGLFLNNTTAELVAGGSLQDSPTQQQAFLLRSAPLSALFPGSITSVTAGRPTALEAWPNPVGIQGKLTISADFARSSPLVLYDIRGRIVRSWPKAAGLGGQQVSLQGLPAGLYLLRSTNAGNTPATLRILKE